VTITDLFATTATEVSCQGGGGTAYADAREGTGSKAANTGNPVWCGWDRLSATDQYFEQLFLQFSTNLLPDTPAVDTAVLTLFGNATQTPAGLGTLRFRGFDWGASVGTADFRAGSALAAISLLASFVGSGWSTSGANAFTAEAGMNGWINVSSVSRAMVAPSTQESAVDDGGTHLAVTLYAEDEAGTTLDPRLTVSQGEEAAAGPVPYRDPRQLVAFRGY
jgi:hypothetical protein